ncbi:MAG TPA: adenylate/guanylate cyclase domain-containing protein [Rectinemataceae bacterium]|nr:adenylate/guanylate cyclase domain-containing protein [Rectinemataceae bacterium]
MSIRLKIILVVLPLIVAGVVLVGISSYFVAASAVTKIATNFLTFKASELEKYANGQFNLLAQNGFVGRADMESAAHAAVESFARSILRSDTETILAVDAGGMVQMRAGPAQPLAAEDSALSALAKAGGRGFATMPIGGRDRVAAYFPFQPFGWFVLVTEDKAAFYGDVESILRTSVEFLVAVALVSVIILLVLARFLTRPLEKVSEAMLRITESNDLSERVPVEYKDEIGRLSHTFNLMLDELGQAYEKIKKYAYDAVVAQKKERKIRSIFEVYVPRQVIDQVFTNPEDMLVGDDRILSVLFSDIRSFTSISEKMKPDDLVTSLNRYFSSMVDVIMGHGGVVDKYIGDAIMAFWGAPTKKDDDAYQSVMAGLQMTEALEAFNRDQTAKGKPPFRIGVGINYGLVTVGNIGCDKKMNYTVIGDMVNLASRLEGATKRYRQPMIISESVYHKVESSVSCRQIDTVAVKGKTQGVKIFTPRKSLSPVEAQAWELHSQALESYYSRDFRKAAEGFSAVLALLPEDYPAQLFLERSTSYAKTPPPEKWDGVVVLTEK